MPWSDSGSGIEMSHFFAGADSSGVGMVVAVVPPVAAILSRPWGVSGRIDGGRGVAVLDTGDGDGARLCRRGGLLGESESVLVLVLSSGTLVR